MRCGRKVRPPSRWLRSSPVAKLPVSARCRQVTAHWTRRHFDKFISEVVDREGLNSVYQHSPVALRADNRERQVYCYEDNDRRCYKLIENIDGTPIRPTNHIRNEITEPGCTPDAKRGEFPQLPRPTQERLVRHWHFKTTIGPVGYCNAGLGSSSQGQYDVVYCDFGRTRIAGRQS